MPEDQDTIDPEALYYMRQSKGDWYAYRNEDLGHPECGRLSFLKCGPGCTHKKPPVQSPDTDHIGPGWRYRLHGKVNVKDGTIEPVPEPVE